MRALLFALVVANFIAFAWARWFAPSAMPLPSSPTPEVPRLMLASEMSLPVDAPTALPDSAACRSIGPFISDAEAARASAAFVQSGYDAHTRSEESRIAEGFWVSLPQQPNSQTETRVLARLARAGITDASVMSVATGRRISVGLFSERERADRRAGEVQRLGFAPDVTERLRIGTSYWVDLELRSPEELREAEAFNSDSSSQLELKPCPAANTPVG